MLTVLQLNQNEPLSLGMEADDTPNITDVFIRYVDQSLHILSNHIGKLHKNQPAIKDLRKNEKLMILCES